VSLHHALVTGGAGFIGARLCSMLVERGLAVTVLDDLSMGVRERVPSGARLMVGDIRDPGAVQNALDGVDVVFHLAARVTIRGSTGAGLFDDYSVNLGGTVQLLAALPGSRVRKLIFASSMAVYADATSPLAEDAPTVPISPYGASKLAAEHYCRAICEAHDIDQISLRYFNTWGPGQTPTPYVGVVTIFVDRVLRGQAPIVFGDGAQTRDFVHVDDVARATVAAMDADLQHAVLNVGTGAGTTVRELAVRLCELADPRLTPEHAPAHAGELRWSVADLARVRAALAWEPTRPLDLGEVLLARRGVV
jgi:UDP-glucose 4-epimerase